MENLNWILYPQSQPSEEVVDDVIWAFEQIISSVSSATQDDLVSNQVLELLRPHLELKGFEVETGKKKSEKISVPVLYGMNGKVEKAFEADAVDRKRRLVLEVEAGRAVANNQFLKDLFQACMMYGIDYLAVAVRNQYRGSKDFLRAKAFFDTLYASGRLPLPLKGVVLIGY